jgi:cholesterol oxidase
MKTYDYIIIGSGFGGSVSALRLAEKGYKVLVIEKGKWYTGKDFPKTNWQLRKWLWLPSLRFFGIMKMTYFRHVGIISGVGVGGGSLVYANTLPRPKNRFYTTGSWANLTDWKTELSPFYDTALKMLGAARNPQLFDSDVCMQELAKAIGKEKDFSPTDVAVFFGEPDKEVADPFFDGKGPKRTGCNHCGKCMTGCPTNAKNTLDKNYLYLAQQLGVEILAEHEVTDIQYNESEKSYTIRCRSSTRYFSGTKKFNTSGVILSGGVLGTVPLLLRLKKKSLPNLSPRLGELVRTNNEALIFNVTENKTTDYTRGVAIGSIIHVDDNSHLEPVRYGKGSGFWRVLMAPMITEKHPVKRWLKWGWTFISSPIRWLKVYTVADFAKRSSILLFMQDLESTITFKQGWWRMKSIAKKGESPTAFIPEAHALAKKHAEITTAKSVVVVSETLTGIPSTAHILGGCVMGDSPETGVIDVNNQVFGYPNMYVCDGSMISANPGVNPSLSITAITERAMSKIAVKKA